MNEKMSKRIKWNNLASKATSEIVNGEVEVYLTKDDKFGIYSESLATLIDAVSHFVAAGSIPTEFRFFEADEDAPEAWDVELFFND